MHFVCVFKLLCKFCHREYPLAMKLEIIYSANIRNPNDSHAAAWVEMMDIRIDFYLLIALIQFVSNYFNDFKVTWIKLNTSSNPFFCFESYSWIKIRQTLFPMRSSMSSHKINNINGTLCRWQTDVDRLCDEVIIFGNAKTMYMFFIQ